MDDGKREHERRLAEEVEKVRKTMAGVGKQAKGDLQRVAEMEESLKKLEKEVRAKDVDDRKMTRNFAETGEKKVTREGRRRFRPRGDETHRMNEPAEKAEEKVAKARVSKGRKEDKEVKERDRRCRARKMRRIVVAPNTGAGGSHPLPPTDPEEEGRKEEGAEAEEQQCGGRKRSQAGQWTLRPAREWQKWADCVDVELEEEEGESREAGDEERAGDARGRGAGGARGRS